MNVSDSLSGLTPHFDMSNPNVATLAGLRLDRTNFGGTAASLITVGSGANGVSFSGITLNDQGFLPSTASLSVANSLNGSGSATSVLEAPALRSNKAIFIKGSPPTAPSAAVVAGGAVPVGFHAYQITAVDVNSGETISVPTNATTTTGNQTVNLSWTAPSPAPAGYNVYRDGSPVNAFGSRLNGALVTTTSYSDSSAIAGFGTEPSGVGGGPTGIGSVGQWTNQQIITNGVGKTTVTSTATAARTAILPDISGTYAILNEQYSAYDNFNRANGAIGSNWTVPNGSINITSNQIVGGGTSPIDNIGFWNVSNFVADQFAQAVVTNTAQPVGPGVRISGAAGSNLANGYFCVENATTTFMLKLTAGVESIITSGATTNAVGDIVRTEIIGTAINCYQNGVKVLGPNTDSSFSSGQPGVDVQRTSGNLDNWSGGNLHPIAQLDTEQDWTQPQHFTQPVTVGAVTPVAGALPAGSVTSSGNMAMLGVACTNGELALSAGWQSTGTATVTAVAGAGQTCMWTITTGTTTAANPTVTDTLTNVLPTATTVCEMNIHGGTHTSIAGEYFLQTTLSATAPVFTFQGTPTAGGTTYFVTRRCGP